MPPPPHSLGGIIGRHILSAKRILGAEGDKEEAQRGFTWLGVGSRRVVLSGWKDPQAKTLVDAQGRSCSVGVPLSDFCRPRDSQPRRCLLDTVVRFWTETQDRNGINYVEVVILSLLVWAQPFWEDVAFARCQRPRLPLPHCSRHSRMEGGQKTPHNLSPGHTPLMGCGDVTLERGHGPR